MFQYKSKPGIGTVYILAATIMLNILLLITIKIANDFIMNTFLLAALIVANVYQLYYLVLSVSISYILKEEYLEISTFGGLKKVKIPYNRILEFKNSSLQIKGMQLMGIGKKTFAYGRFFVSKMGTCRMFLTNNKNGLFIKTPGIVFAISPENLMDFKDKLLVKVNNVETVDYTEKKVIPLHKDKYFIASFTLNTVLIFVYILTPLYLYFAKKLKTDKMPMTFNEHFYPIKWGTPKEFVKTQIFYGVLAMAVLFCLYYVSHIYARYDRKASYLYIYIPLIIIIVLLTVQLVILKNFN